MNASPAARVALGIRLGFAAVMIAAAVPKIADPAAFAWAVARHGVPDAWIGAIAVFLPWTELATAVAALAVRPLRRGALVLGAALLALFSAVIAVNLLRGAAAPCGCFGLSPDAGPAGWGHVAATLAGAVACGWTATRESATGIA